MNPLLSVLITPRIIFATPDPPPVFPNSIFNLFKRIA